MSKVNRVIWTGAFSALLLAVPSIAAERAAWPAETLSGTIASVDPGQRLLVVKDSNGVPFDIVVGSHTRIMAADQSLKLKDLDQDVNRSVSVRFVPERRGDVAQSIRISS